MILIFCIFIKHYSKIGTYYSLREAIAIPEGADLNDYGEFGNYASVTGDVSNTLLNCPHKDGGFMLHVEKTTSSVSNRNFAKQRLVCNNTECIEEVVSGKRDFGLRLNLSTYDFINISNRTLFFFHSNRGTF